MIVANCLYQIMALEEMKKNVEKLDELDESLKTALDELGVSTLILGVFQDSWIPYRLSIVLALRESEKRCVFFNFYNRGVVFLFYQELNTEEELLQWEPTQFPILQTMLAYKEPYDKLWRTALSFNNKHETWLNGMDTLLVDIFLLHSFPSTPISFLLSPFFHFFLSFLFSLSNTSFPLVNFYLEFLLLYLFIFIDSLKSFHFFFLASFYCSFPLSSSLYVHFLPCHSIRFQLFLILSFSPLPFLFHSP